MERAPSNIQRRVRGYHDIRLDGMVDLVSRARGSSVMDIGCNRGMVGFEMACNGATLVHGCDNYEIGISVAKEIFADLKSVSSQFEVVDLSIGPKALDPFGDQRYDIVLCLATYHKLKRVMDKTKLSSLMKALGDRTKGLFAWRGTSHPDDRMQENIDEMEQLDLDLIDFKRIHTSFLSEELGPAAVWRRK